MSMVPGLRSVLPPAAPLRFATYNLKDFFDPRADRIVEERAVVEQKVANVAASLRRADADVVALQEVGSPSLLRRLSGIVADLGYGDPVLGSEDRRGIRNVILSRLPIQWAQVHETRSLPFPRMVEGDSEPFAGRLPLRRGVVHVRVDAGAFGEVDVLTVHLKSGLPLPQKTTTGDEIPDATFAERGASSIRSLVLRSAEALFVRSLLDGIFAQSPDHAICLMGDFNDTLDSIPLRLVQGVESRAASSSGVLHACSDRIPPERRFSTYHARGKLLIDHVLLSERLHTAVARVEIHNEALRDHGDHGAVAGASAGTPAANQGNGEVPLVADSDHALCFVEIK
jgi:endonuclease/exonuclease/phosphatase family metal-dependent hydrolase